MPLKSDITSERTLQNCLVSFKFSCFEILSIVPEKRVLSVKGKEVTDYVGKKKWLVAPSLDTFWLCWLTPPVWPLLLPPPPPLPHTLHPHTRPLPPLWIGRIMIGCPILGFWVCFWSRFWVGGRESGRKHMRNMCDCTSPGCAHTAITQPWGPRMNAHRSLIVCSFTNPVRHVHKKRHPCETAQRVLEIDVLLMSAKSAMHGADNRAIQEEFLKNLNFIKAV